MILFLPSEHSGSVAPLPGTPQLKMHSRENVVCFRFLPGNLQDLHGFLRLGTEIQSDTFDGNIEGSCQGSGLNQWKKRWYGLFRILPDHSSASKRYESVAVN